MLPNRLAIFRTMIYATLVATSAFAAEPSNLCTTTGMKPKATRIGMPIDWGTPFATWGKANMETFTDRSSGATIARVWYPAGTYDPGSMIAQGKPVGGSGYSVRLAEQGFECAVLTYKVRFSESFNFVQGGKLPGLAGGIALTYPNIPRGVDGFSARLMWRKSGEGEVYAYLRTTPTPGTYYGTSIGRGSWRFAPGGWHTIEQAIMLNAANRNDGRLSLRVDGVTVIDELSLQYRDRPDVRIDGVIFETFFGGNTADWATPAAVFTEFSAFSLVGYER